MLNKDNSCLFLVGNIVSKDHLLQRIIYYKKFFFNIILITYEACVIDYKDEILKHLDEKNLFLIKSNISGEGIKNKLKITPYKLTQPNFSFYIDGSLYPDPFKHHPKKRNLYNIYGVYHYMNLYKNKYEYCLIYRSDMDFSLNSSVLEEMEKKASLNKIIMPSMSTKNNYDKSFKYDKYMDQNKHFWIRHQYQHENEKLSCFYLDHSFIFAKWKIFKELLDINNSLNNKRYKFSKYKLWPNAENWFVGPYIFNKEKRNYIPTENIENIVYKYFDFIYNYEFNKNECKMCCYNNKDFFNNKDKYPTGSLYPCRVCKKKNILI
jgi:hypothetical protein